jgi:m7GpppX diphosphatase
LNISSKLVGKSFDIQWVYNILEHKKESERIVFEDSDKFILLPDMKWDGTTIENMYLQAIVHQHGIKDLRDLNGTHLPLLQNVKDLSYQAIEKKYGLKRSQVRAFLHYPPSFYHLHVHFTHIRYQVPGFPERNHLLEQVIENLKLDSDYYKKVSIQCVIKRNDPIYELVKQRFE